MVYGACAINIGSSCECRQPVELLEDKPDSLSPDLVAGDRSWRYVITVDQHASARHL
jgi:hypothetical protein